MRLAKNILFGALMVMSAPLTWTQYLTFTGIIDDEKGIREHNEEIHESLLESIRQNTEMKRYKEAGFSFAYICRSKKDPKTILLTLKYTPKDYR